MKHTAAWAWLILLVLVNAYWLVWDFLLVPRFGWKTMTAQMQDWLHDPVVGPLMFGVLVAIPAIFLYHIFVRATS